MSKRVLSFILVLTLLISLPTTAFAAQSYSEKSLVSDEYFLPDPISVQVTNVVSHEQKDYSVYLSNIDETIEGTNSHVLYCNAPTTITLMPYEDSRLKGAYVFSLWYDTNKVPEEAVTENYKYYALDEATFAPITSQKYEGVPEDFGIPADGSSITINKAGTYALFVKPYCYFDPTEYDYQYVFIVVGDSSPTVPAPTPTPAPAPVPVTTATATPTSSKVYVNGKLVEFDAYTINGNNYFKLRDLAKVVSGTEKQFEVTWDGAKNAINLISDESYTAVGGELSKGDGKVKTATICTSTIYKDGEEIALTAYTINGNNYFKLRDVAQVFNIGVGWDGQTNTITIDTSIDYEP